MFRTAQYFRLTNEEERHRGFQYKDGLNVDTNKFHPYEQSKQGSCLLFSTTAVLLCAFACRWRKFTFNGKNHF